MAARRERAAAAGRVPCAPMISAWIDRVLAAVSDAEEDGRRRRSQLQAFRRFVLLHGCVRSWLWLEFGSGLGLEGGSFSFDSVPAVAAAGVLTLALALSCWPRAEMWAPRVALPALIWQGVATFPVTDNHFALELLAVGLLCLVGTRSRRDEQLVLAGLRWLAVLVLFHTGLSKLLYGHYLHGDFLAFMIGQGGRFAELFDLLLPAGEVARLQGYDPLRTGAGPFRVDSIPLLLVSNGVWIAEIGLAVGLVFRRTRLFAAGGAVLLVLAIQLGARELGFAFLFVNLLLLFTPDGNRRLLPFAACAYLYALAAVLGGLPGGERIEGGWL